jgi:hypothetical protein
MGLLSEAVTDQPVRQVVKDIIKMVKTQVSREYHLPEEISEDYDTEYNFPKIPFSFSVILDLIVEDGVKYNTNAELLGDDTIVVLIKINKMEYPSILFTLVSDLNELIAHEIEHIYQNYGYRDVSLEKYPEYSQTTGKEYYKHPIEVPAQIKGFQRQSKVTGKPVEELMRNYFNRVKANFNLTD